MSGLTVTSLVTRQETMPLTCGKAPTRSPTSCRRARATQNAKCSLSCGNTYPHASWIPALSSAGRADPGRY